jgi:ornithine carbamoyltransferase
MNIQNEKIKKDFTSLADLSAKELWLILKFAKELKEELKKTGKNKPLLHNKTLAMLFEKASLRTRVSFETGMTQLGRTRYIPFTFRYWN